jgi:hypothetical protein
MLMPQNQRQTKDLTRVMITCLTASIMNSPQLFRESHPFPALTIMRLFLYLPIATPFDF